MEFKSPGIMGVGDHILTKKAMVLILKNAMLSQLDHSHMTLQ
jgi:hypothetical protein